MTSIRALLAALLRAARTLWSGIAVAFNLLKRIVSWLIVTLVGRWEWQAPAWLPWTVKHSTRGRRYLAANPTRAAALAVAILAAAGGYAWYATRPKPHYVTYSVKAPGLTEYNDKGISSIKLLTIGFSESAAPLRQVQKVVTTRCILSRVSLPPRAARMPLSILTVMGVSSRGMASAAE